MSMRATKTVLKTQRIISISKVRNFLIITRMLRKIHRFSLIHREARVKKLSVLFFVFLSFFVSLSYAADITNEQANCKVRCAKPMLAYCSANLENRPMYDGRNLVPDSCVKAYIAHDRAKYEEIVGCLREC